MIFSFIIALSAVILTVISQIFLKLGAKKAINKNIIFLYLNPNTILGYFFLLIVTLLNLFAYKILPLKFAIILLPITFILVIILSKLILKENLFRKQIIGILIITLGIVIFNIKL